MNLLKNLFGKKEDKQGVPSHMQNFKVFGSVYRRENKTSKIMLEDALLKFSEGSTKNSFVLEVSKDEETFYFPISAKMDLREQSSADGDNVIRKYVFDLEQNLRIRIEFDVTLPKDLEEVLKFETFFSELVVINTLQRDLKVEDKERVKQACRHVVGKDLGKESATTSQKDSEVFSIASKGKEAEDKAPSNTSSSSSSSINRLVKEMEGLNIEQAKQKQANESSSSAAQLSNKIKLFQKRPEYLAKVTEEEEKQQIEFQENRILLNQNNQKLQDSMLEIIQLKEIKLAQIGCLYEAVGNEMVLKYQGIIFAIKQLEQFDFKVLIFNEDKLVIHQYHFEAGNSYEISNQFNYLRWIETKSNFQILYQVTFDQPNVSKDIAYIIQKCHYEATNKVDYATAFKDEEIQEQMKYATKCEKEDDSEYSSKNSDYLNDTILDFTFNPKVYQSQGKAATESHLRSITQAKTLDRTFVSHGENIEVYRTSKDNEELDLQYLLQFPIVKGLDGEIFEPKKMLLQEQDTKMLLLNNEENKKVFYFDIEKGKVIQEFTVDEYMANGIKDICNQAKNGDLDNNKTFYSINSKNIFLMDPRVAKENQIACTAIEQKIYSANNRFTCISSTQNGEFAIGSADGTVRLYNKVSKNAKNSFNLGYGDSIRGLDISKDGKWILATCQTYLILLPTYDQANTDKSGFSSVVKLTDRSSPIRLQLTCEDQFNQKIKDVSFTPAKFDNIINSNEQFIITSSGDLIVIWNFAQVLRGKRFSYEIKKSDDEIQYTDFKFNQLDNVLAASSSKVEMSTLTTRKHP